MPRDEWVKRREVAEGYERQRSEEKSLEQAANAFLRSKGVTPKQAAAGKKKTGKKWWERRKKKRR